MILYLENLIVYPKAPSAGKQLQQSVRIHNQHIKITSICIYTNDSQETFRFATKRIKYQGGERSLQGDTNNCSKKSERTQTNEKTIHAHGKEESISLKW